MVPTLVGIAVAVVALFAWYGWCKRKNQQRAHEILRWIESTLGTRSQMQSIDWLTPASFRVALRTAGDGVFRRAAVLVDLAPMHSPYAWLRRKLDSRQDTVTFEADLEASPRCMLDLHTYKLFARTRRDLQPEGAGWQFETTTPLVMTTRNEWQREVTGVISSLLQRKEKQFLDLRFAPESPNLSVTLPLGAIAPNAENRLEMATMIRELATEFSSSHGFSY